MKASLVSSIITTSLLVSASYASDGDSNIHAKPGHKPNLEKAAADLKKFQDYDAQGVVYLLPLRLVKKEAEVPMVIPPAAVGPYRFQVIDGQVKDVPADWTQLGKQGGGEGRGMSGSRYSLRA